MTTLNDLQPVEAEYNGFLAIRDALDGQATQNELFAIAEVLEQICNVMRQRRHEVEQIDPWRWGLLIAILGERLSDGRKRFEVLQEAGYWRDYDFDEWCNEMTGRSPNTWRTWKRAAEVYLLQGNEQVRGGLSAGEFIARVHMDKALRFLGVASTLTMTSSHQRALVDPGVTSHQARMLLAVPDGMDARLNNGEDSKSDKEDDEDMNMSLQLVDNVLYFVRGHERALVCRFAIAKGDSIVRVLQDTMLSAAYHVLDELRRNKWRTM